MVIYCAGSKRVSCANAQQAEGDAAQGDDACLVALESSLMVHP